MNLEGFTMRTRDDEFTRVVRQEAGHTLGFEHEHMREELVDRLDRKKAFAYYDRTQGWTRKETLEQVLQRGRSGHICRVRQNMGFKRTTCSFRLVPEQTTCRAHVALGRI